MATLWIAAGGFEFIGRLEEELAPKTCEALRTILPFQDRLIHVRWSGQPMWTSYGDVWKTSKRWVRKYPGKAHKRSQLITCEDALTRAPRG